MKVRDHLNKLPPKAKRLCLIIIYKSNNSWFLNSDYSSIDAVLYGIASINTDTTKMTSKYLDSIILKVNTFTNETSARIN